MMKKLILAGAAALMILPTGAALAVPMCDGPEFFLKDPNGKPLFSEEELAAQAQQELRARGIDASNTRFWNGCLQTFVRENGHETMRFYDPNSYREIPVN